MLLDKIPGYKEAMAEAATKEAGIRDIAFLNIPLDICGVAVRQLTLRHMAWLYAIESPFLCGGAPNAGHVAQFLWCVSPGFHPGDFPARDAFLATIDGDVAFASFVSAIDTYLDEALMDRPPRSGGSKGVAITSFVAGYLDIFAAAYGWPRDAILDSPISQLFQLMRRIERRGNPNAVFFNRLSDKAQKRIVADWKKGGK